MPFFHLLRADVCMYVEYCCNLRVYVYIWRAVEVGGFTGYTNDAYNIFIPIDLLPHVTMEGRSSV